MCTFSPFPQLPFPPYLSDTSDSSGKVSGVPYLLRYNSLVRRSVSGVVCKPDSLFGLKGSLNKQKSR
jgi:hypothetical protein